MPEPSETRFPNWCRDTLGCLLDLDHRSMQFFVNGNPLLDAHGGEVAFRNFPNGERFVPALALGPGERVEVNLGADPATLRFRASREWQPVATYCSMQVRRLSLPLPGFLPRAPLLSP